MTSFLVTLSAILRYLAKARAAKEELDRANEEMKNAAAALCSIWQGKSTEAFAAEQDVLCGWCSEMSGIGSEYMDTLVKVCQVYQEAEERVTGAVKG